jgi:hypothetical protein
MQRAVNTTIEEEVFSMCPPRDYTSGRDPNEMSRRNENGTGARPRQPRRKVRLQIHCESLQLTAITSDRTIQNPLLFVTEPQTRYFRQHRTRAVCNMFRPSGRRHVLYMHVTPDVGQNAETC